ncbi:unnamed protein product [Bursaphelenchus xylophilus]|uniref:(pine wood nematode) hypothetical protein n=1 Tax=Bursaphelenchus xylophilus TaxID=6326 RepID=A0A1I7S6R0_BURXY|nr:unnamed protein product [Bursaphelenchus xylophilus]CAG9120692.1 unnamed protein product [Bursaphelenchus xylophilus]
MLTDLLPHLKCCLCDVLMSPIGRAPTCLDCGHVFCSPCVEESRSFCPICRLQSYRAPLCRPMAAILELYHGNVSGREAPPQPSPLPTEIHLEDVATPQSQSEEDVDSAVEDVANPNIICGRHNLARYDVDRFYVVKVLHAGVHVDLPQLHNIFPGSVFAFAYKATDQKGYRTGNIVIGLFTEEERLRIFSCDGKFFAGRILKVVLTNSPALPILQASFCNSAVLVENIPFLEAMDCLEELVDHIEGTASLRVGRGPNKHLGAIHLHDFRDVRPVLEKNGIVLFRKRLTLTPISLAQFSHFETYSSYL